MERASARLALLVGGTWPRPGEGFETTGASGYYINDASRSKTRSGHGHGDFAIRACRVTLSIPPGRIGRLPTILKVCARSSFLPCWSLIAGMPVPFDPLNEAVLIWSAGNRKCLEIVARPERVLLLEASLM